MRKLLTTIGLLLVFGTGFSPMLANWLWDDPFLAMDSAWFRPLLYTGIALIFVPTILFSIFGAGRVTKGQSAVGVITEVQQTGTQINGQPEVKLRFMVTKPGEEKYPAELTTVIPLTSLAEFQPGSMVPLIVSEKNNRRIGLDLNSQLSLEQLQSMMNEQMVKQGASSEMMKLAASGQKAYAKIIGITPLGSAGEDRVKLSVELEITGPDGATFRVNTQKELAASMLPKVQPGQVIQVFYSKEDPSKVAFALQADEQAIRQAFGSA
ncbi:hypothetical protein DCC85_05480 [Paenibacillus sp. CAA11]|uniref:hypothetical protein n=1 Tax=Paenibacillus sp. CAA11 TaxID=1532905 RepID=UPI000D3BAFB9|nr:hypothetical protein [Paenibacillus sp. CAA11]AWB43722.1 hypothetical protein DCC85_05480 [Paenibacillus sp. CAA11]